MRRITLLFFYFFYAGVYSQPLNQDLLLHYRFDGTTSDASGNGYDATPFGIVYGPDRFGNANAAAHFDGIDDYVNFPNIAALKVPLPVSFAFWIKYEGNTYNQQVVFNTSMEENHATSVVFNAQSGTNKYVINYADGDYFYGEESRRSYVSNNVITTVAWHQVVVVVNSATDMKIYIDCEEKGGDYSGSGGSLAYSMQPGCIGRHDRSLQAPLDYFKGYIDDFRYWKRALNVTDVAELCEGDVLGTAQPEKPEFTIFPNPATEMLYIETSNPLKNVILYNALGQQVYQGVSTQIDVRALASGMYILRIESDTISICKKVIIK